ncbi:MAG: PHB depolymerase family esterase [Deltaproteobacteria bacterium]
MKRRGQSLAGLCLAAACALGACHTEPPPERSGPTPQQEAAALLEQARREVEQEKTVPPASAATLEVPESAAGRVPLIVFLHGLGGSGAELSLGLHLKEFSDRLGFAFLAPDGLLDNSGRRFWNASASCCNFDQLSVDHVGLLRSWIQDALKNPKLDPTRVYLVGYSNGGFLAHRAACELGSLLRGIYSIGGAGPNQPKRCHPDKLPNVVEIHAEDDAIVAFKGGYLFADRSRPPHPSAEATVRAWRKLAGCSEPALATADLDLDPRIPGAETQVWSFPGCKASSVELWRIRGGNHGSGLSRLSVLAIWESIQAQQRAQAAPP